MSWGSRSRLFELSRSPSKGYSLVFFVHIGKGAGLLICYAKVMAIFKPEQVELIYIDSSGQEHSQFVSELIEIGTLIDPDTGDDMDVDHVVATF